MSKDYYIIYKMTVPKGLQRKTIERNPYTNFADLFGISFLVTSVFRVKSKYTVRFPDLTRRIKLVCWRHGEGLKNGSYEEPVYRQLAFSTKKVA